MHTFGFRTSKATTAVHRTSCPKRMCIRIRRTQYGQLIIIAWARKRENERKPEKPLLYPFAIIALFVVAGRVHEKPVCVIVTFFFFYTTILLRLSTLHRRRETLITVANVP